MLRNFRQVFKGNQTPMAVIMMVVLLGMVAYLAPSGGNAAAPDNVMARVYGRDVLKREMDSQIAQFVKRMGKQANLDAMMPMLQEQALDMLIGERLREELADRHGILVTDDEIRSSLETRLKSIPLFLDEKGNLRPSSEINSLLREHETSLKEFEKEIATELRMHKLVSQAAARVPVDQAWVDLEHRVRDEKITFEFVTCSPDAGPLQDPGDATLQAFLRASGARFQEGPRRVLSYVSLDQAALGIQPADDGKVQALYEKRKPLYEELKASHILFSATTESQFADALKKAQDLRAKLVAGGDFAKAADANTEDPSGKGHGGDLGWFAPRTMDKAFADAAQALKPGEISQPVRSQHGIHLIRLEGRRVKPFDDVKEELRAQITRETVAARAKDRLEQLRKRVGDRGDLAAAARNLGLKAQTSKAFSENDPAGIEGMPGSQSLVNESFHMAVGQVSRIRQAGLAFVVFRVQEERPVAVPPLADIRAKVLDAWKQEEARKAAQLRAGKISGDLNALGTPETKDAATLVSLGELGQHPAIRKALLETPVGHVTAPCWTPDGKVWVARIKSRTPAEPLTFETRRTLVNSIQEKAAEKLLSAELRDLAVKGRQHPGLSSLYGRVGGIWMNEEALKKLQADAPDVASDQE